MAGETVSLSDSCDWLLISNAKLGLKFLGRGMGIVDFELSPWNRGLTGCEKGSLTKCRNSVFFSSSLIICISSCSLNLTTSSMGEFEHRPWDKLLVDF